ncbi:MAG: glycosyltransferase [Ignavibacteria bacterium]
MLNDIFYVLLWVCTILLIISGFDDMFVDLMYWITRRKYKRSMPNMEKVNRADEHSIALLICAWKEHAVLGRTLEYALKNIDYSNYHIFIGVYPNDERTVNTINRVTVGNGRVTLCYNVKEGPTTKADNLNSVYSHLKKFETEKNKEFDVILIHDSEDFIHPESLKLYNYMLIYQGIDAVQIPVVPVKNSNSGFIHRTYCDGFAEMHSKDMVVRQYMNAFIPFAGAGMAFKRELFKSLEEKYPKLFNDAILTEDYELGLRLYELGYKVLFVNLQMDDEKGNNSRIATGEFFPNNFWGAVKQRSRWTAGICFQSWLMHRWPGNLTIKYFLMRDRKTVLSNIVILLSNITFALTLIYILGFAGGTGLGSVVIEYSILWVFLWVCLVFMVWRLIHRFIFTFSWYGFKYAVFSIIRMQIDNLINFFATFRAFKVFLKTRKKVVWESTEHY